MSVSTAPSPSRLTLAWAAIHRRYGVGLKVAVAVWVLSPSVWSQDTPNLPLPELPGFPAGQAGYENPLLLFQEGKVSPAEAWNPATPDEQPRLSPFMPGEERPAAPVLTAEEQQLMELASKVAGSVVSVRVWDEYGGMLASGVGCFVSQDGVILTDTSLVHPEIAERVDYITTTAANGTNHRVSGFYQADLRSGVTLLQSEGPSQPALILRTAEDFSKPQPCHVLAVSDSRGLVLADATVQQEDTLAGQNWLSLTGDDSPGAPGSPVLARDGSVLGIVGMKTPLDSWMNFALPCEMAAYELQRRRPALKPLSQLPTSPQLSDVTADPTFVEAFQLLQRRRFESATRKLLGLTNTYPRSAECWALLGLAASSLGASPDALSCQRKAVALDPQAGLYWHQLALAKLRTSSDGSLASEDFEAIKMATEKEPNDRIGWLLLASHYLKQGKLQEADDALVRLTLLAPGYAQGYYLLAYVRGRSGDHEGAAAAIDRCLKLDGDSAEAWYYLGLVEDKMGEPLRASAAYKNTVRLQPNHPQAWLNMAHSLKRAKRSTDARNAFLTHQKVTSERQSAVASQP